jgi:hypothetical protein
MLEYEEYLWSTVSIVAGKCTDAFQFVRSVFLLISYQHY